MGCNEFPNCAQWAYELITPSPISSYSVIPTSGSEAVKSEANFGSETFRNRADYGRLISIFSTYI